MPAIQHEAYAAVLFFPDRHTATKFATQFIEDKPTLNDKPLYAKPQLPPSVTAAQRPLVNARHVLATEKKGEKTSIDFRKRMVYLGTSCVAKQLATGTLMIDPKFDKSIGDKMLAASTNKDYFKNLKSTGNDQAPPAKRARDDHKGGKGKGGKGK